MANFDFSFYFSLFRKRLPYFLGIAILVATTGVLVIYSLPSVYRATAKILVESPQIPEDLARSTVPTGAGEQFQIIQEDVLSRENLVALADRFAIYDGRKSMTDIDVADDMLHRIVIAPVRLDATAGDAAASVFAISFDAAQPVLAANVTNDLVSMILRKDVELRTGRATDTVQFFNQEVTRLSGELKEFDARILQFKNDHVDALPDSLTFRRDQQSAQQQKLLLLAQEEATLRKRLADLQSGHFAFGTAPTTPEEKGLADLRQALVQQLAIFSESSPTIKTLRARIAGVETQIRTAQNAPPTTGDKSLPASDADLERASITDRLSAIAQEQTAIAKANDALSASILATPANDTALSAMERNRDNLQAQYNAAVGRLAEASTGQQIELRLKGERLSLVESAVPPQSAASPKRKLLLIASAIAAFMVALAAIVLPEFLNKSVRRPVELVSKLDIRPMITVPYIVTGGERSRKRLTSFAAILMLVAAIPLLLLALHSYVAPVDALMNKTLSGFGLSEVHQNG